MGDPVTQVFNGQEVEVWPQIVWKPKWGLTFSEIKKKISGSCSISQRSAMVINGRDIFVEDLSLDGALLVNSVDEAEVNESHHSPAEPHIFGNSVLSFFLSFFLPVFPPVSAPCRSRDRCPLYQVKVGGKVQNKGWVIENVDHKDTSVPEQIRIRGFRINKVEQLEGTYDVPGKFSL